jgi:hypothetical protein
LTIRVSGKNDAIERIRFFDVCGAAGRGKQYKVRALVLDDLAKRSKGARGMPWRGQAMKDVASCEKPWGGARFL